MKKIQHKLKILIDDSPYRCPDCNVMVSELQSFRKHMLEHSGEKQYACAVCSFSSRHWSAIKKHIVSHKQKRYSCSKCSKTFKWRRSLKHHVFVVHAGEEPFSCPFCTKTFGHSQSLTGHFRVHRQLFSASVSAVETVTSSPVLKQLGLKPSSFDDDDVQPDKVHCSSLSNVGTGATTSAAHLLETHSAFSTCGKKFPKKQNGSRYERTRTCEKPNSCSKCFNRFSNYCNNVAEHEKDQCNCCEISYTSLNNRISVRNSAEHRSMPGYHTTGSWYQQSTGSSQTYQVKLKVNTFNGKDELLKTKSVCMDSRTVDKLPNLDIDRCSIDDTCDFECHYCESVFSSQEALMTHCIDIHVHSKLRQSCVGCCSELIQLVMNHACSHQTKIKEDLDILFPGQNEDKSNTTEDPQTYGDVGDVGTVQELSDDAYVERKIKRKRVRPKIGVNEYKCWHCNLVFTTLKSLREHRINVHRNEKRFKCNICDKAYKRQDSLESHLRGHTGEKPYSCPECNKAFAMSNKLKLHMQTHNSSKMFLCKDCGKSLASMHTLRLHSRIHTGEKPFKCPLCDRTFPRSDAMKSHLRSHRSDQTNTDVVSHSTCSNGDLKEHVPLGEKTNKILLKRNSSPTTENCCLDAVSGATSTTLDLTTVFRKRFMCSECGKQFFEHSMLVRHLRTHTGEKPFKCTDCSASFGDQGNLKRHKRQHTGEKPYRCSECSRQFSFSHSLKVHQLSHTRKKQKEKSNDVP